MGSGGPRFAEPRLTEHSQHHCRAWCRSSGAETLAALGHGRRRRKPTCARRGATAFAVIWNSSAVQPVHLRGTSFLWITPCLRCWARDDRLYGSRGTRLRRETGDGSVARPSKALKGSERAKDQLGDAMSELENLRDALRVWTNYEPERHDLVAGFVGAIGTKWDPILDLFEESLERFAYASATIRVSRLLETCPYQPWGDLPDRESQDYYTERMDTCDRLRRDTRNGSAMAALSICKIYELRSDTTRAKPAVYLLRSLKHPDEVKLLRHVYGEAFVLIGVASSKAYRRTELISSLGSVTDRVVEAERLIVRDESDSHDKEYGQNVRDTYAMCDVFIPGTLEVSPKRNIDRFVDSIFGQPFLTPTQDEEGMRLAHDASLRSSAAGRQVGAALVPRMGTPVVTGTNEVPKPGGGQYWEGDDPDHRDFKKGRDPNPEHIERALEEIFERLKEHKWLAQDYEDMSASQMVELALRGSDAIASVLEGSRVVSLIEFAPCLHAEQAAFTNAVRSGVSTQGAVLYTTTFPCHECAKMIIGAGVRAVHFVEPYPKSLVNELYSGMIDIDPPLPSSSSSDEGKIPFHQYVGIAPRWYSRAFVAPERKIDNRFIKFERLKAEPRTHGWSESGVDIRQATTVKIFLHLTEELNHQEESQP